MSDSPAHLAGLMKQSGATLNLVSSRFEAGIASADEIAECSRLLFSLADALKLYAEKMPGGESRDGDSLREPPPSA